MENWKYFIARDHTGRVVGAIATRAQPAIDAFIKAHGSDQVSDVGDDDTFLTFLQDEVTGLGT